MNAIKYAITGVLLLLLTTVNLALANSYAINSVPNPYQQSEIIYVVDPDNVLTKEDTDTINQRLEELEQNTNIETAVVALPSIGQVDTREFANKLFNHWKIGKKGQDNGLLILLVIDQRQVVFEVGYGLEGNLTDAKSYRLMDQYMLPLFKQNQFSQGMSEGIDGVATYLEQQYADGTLYSIGSNPSFFTLFLNLDFISYLGMGFYIAIAVAALVLIYSFWGDRIFMIKDWSTAKYVTPFGRFKKSLLLIWVIMVVMTFFFNINPIYYSVMIFLSVWSIALSIVISIFFSIFKKKNNKESQKKLICPTCRHRSIIEITRNKKIELTENEQYLMAIGAVKYRLFHCDEEPCKAIFKGSKVNDGWTICPHCKLPTKKLIKSTIIEPTYQQSGLLTQYYHCIKCLEESVDTKVLPRKRKSSSSSSSGSHGGSGGGGGGGSRGGGSSGGGGARGSF
ncbi:TPM domain-containing protein [Orbus wheelerorum]|uniref:TPM domain-containing protein n=1 Tax=Orbus wheelerorum TaxID=3074111 RepID=UPI00370D98A0